MLFVNLFSPRGRLGRLAYIGYTFLGSLIGNVMMLFGFMVTWSGFARVRRELMGRSFGDALHWLANDQTVGNGIRLGLVIVAFGLLTALWTVTMVAVKRLHDIGVSGHHLWWIFPLQTVPHVTDVPLAVRVAAGAASVVVALGMLCKRGTEGANAYGPLPGEYI